MVATSSAATAESQEPQTCVALVEISLGSKGGWQLAAARGRAGRGSAGDGTWPRWRRVRGRVREGAASALVDFRVDRRVCLSLQRPLSTQLQKHESFCPFPPSDPASRAGRCFSVACRSDHQYCFLGRFFVPSRGKRPAANPALQPPRGALHRKRPNSLIVGTDWGLDLSWYER